MPTPGQRGTHLPRRCPRRRGEGRAARGLGVTPAAFAQHISDAAANALNHRGRNIQGDRYPKQGGGVGHKLPLYISVFYPQTYFSYNTRIVSYCIASHRILLYHIVRVRARAARQPLVQGQRRRRPYIVFLRMSCLLAAAACPSGFEHRLRTTNLFWGRPSPKALRAGKGRKRPNIM